MSSGSVCLEIVGQVFVDEIEANEADGNVDEENQAPVEIADDEAAGDGAEHGTDEAGNGDEAHGANEFGLGKGAHHGEAANGDHHGAAAALQNAAGDEGVDVGGNAAQEGAEREDADGGGEDFAGAVAISHPAADGDEDGEAEGVAGENGLHGEWRDVQGLGDGGDGGVEDGGVERLHEKGDGNQPGEEFFAGFAESCAIQERGAGGGRSGDAARVEGGMSGGEGLGLLRIGMIVHASRGDGGRAGLRSMANQEEKCTPGK